MVKVKMRPLLQSKSFGHKIKLVLGAVNTSYDVITCKKGDLTGTKVHPTFMHMLLVLLDHWVIWWKHLISPQKIHNSTGSHNVKLYKGLLVSKGDAI